MNDQKGTSWEIQPVPFCVPTYTVAEVFPEYLGRESQVALRAYRTREGLTQKELARVPASRSITSAKWRTASAPSARSGRESWPRRWG